MMTMTPSLVNRSRFCLISLSVLMMASTRAWGEAESESARQEFLAEYPEASKQLENYYENMELEFTRKDRNNNYRKYTLMRSGKSLRLVRLASNLDTPYYASVADPALSFRLKRNDGSSRYSIINLDNHGSKPYQLRAKLIRAYALPAFAPYSYYSRPIRDLLFGTATKIESVQESDGPDGRMIQVDWEEAERGEPKTRGSFTFLPDACWALRDYSIYLINRKDKRTGQVLPVAAGRYGHLEYAGLDSGIPLIQRMQTWTSGTAGKFPQYSFDVTRLDLGAVPAEAFTLEAFGIQTGPASDAIPVMYYLLALAALCGLLALVFRVLQKRSARSTTSA